MKIDILINQYLSDLIKKFFWKSIFIVSMKKEK